MPTKGDFYRSQLLKTSGLNLLLLGFLIISFILGAVAVIRQESFDDRQRAYMGDIIPPDNTTTKTAPSPTVNSVATPPKDTSGSVFRLPPINTGDTASAPKSKDTGSTNTVYKPPTNTGSVAVPPKTGTGGSVAAPPQNTGTGSVASGPNHDSDTLSLTGEVTYLHVDLEKLAQGQAKPGQTSAARDERETGAVGEATKYYSPTSTVTIAARNVENTSVKAAVETSALAAKTLSGTSTSGQTTISVVHSSNTTGSTTNAVRVTSDLRGTIQVVVNETAKPAVVEQEVAKKTFGVLSLQQASTPNARVVSDYCPTSSKVCAPMEAYVVASSVAKGTTVNDRGESVSAGSVAKAKTVADTFVETAGNYAINSSANDPALNKVMSDILGSSYSVVENEGRIDSISVTPNETQKTQYLCRGAENCTDGNQCVNAGHRVTSICYQGQPNRGYCCL